MQTKVAKKNYADWLLDWKKKCVVIITDHAKLLKNEKKINNATHEPQTIAQRPADFNLSPLFLLCKSAAQ